MLSVELGSAMRTDAETPVVPKVRKQEVWNVAATQEPLFLSEFSVPATWKAIQRV
eukprot:COSAG02_NODE_7050_length_3209_cov_4.365595_4_plen_55_part_00